MANGRITWEQREELHAILHYCRTPSKKPSEYWVKQCIMHYLMCRDARAEIMAKGVPGFTADIIVKRAMVFLNNERHKRKPKAAEILERRAKARGANTFTSENFRVKIDQHQNRNYGMITTSIYCVVEVWENEEDFEKEYLVNYSDFKTKEWLTKTLVWALMNGREVVIKPATPDQMNTMRMFVPKDKEPLHG